MVWRQKNERQTRESGGEAPTGAVLNGRDRQRWVERKGEVRDAENRAISIYTCLGMRCSG